MTGSPLALIRRYYAGSPEAMRILIGHSAMVAAKALRTAERAGLMIDLPFTYEAAMLHDIGVVRCDAPGIGCYGSEPYIRHGMLGAEILRAEGLPRHALVAERHTGTGLTEVMIRERRLPLPERDFIPISPEEKLICFADKFYSKTHVYEEKTISQARAAVARHGGGGAEIFDEWCRIYLPHS